ncbi:MAG: UDP-N-acetylmuramate--L-alanine ligase [Bacteroidales bacterium]|nr:UDP-N-acetylmuramate--L-alanine ligase [Bacteroidales bacterium]MEE1272137.1 UDP-N-acetylmuramate--L-alanine ligase [Bacteroidales bacterium]
MSSKTYYFVGIGGIGMSAIARYLKNNGHNIYGYDRTRTQLTAELEKEGMNVTYEDDINHLPEVIDLAIYTPAIPAENKILKEIIKRGIQLNKRAFALAEIVKEKKVIAIAGTHGKTTTSGLLAHLLYNSKIGCSAFLGGIANNYSTNMLCDTKSEYVVVEADEYDRSFLNLNPFVSAITSISPDHLDIYQNKENLEQAFAQFANQTDKNGHVFLKKEVKVEIDEQIKTNTYSLTDIESDYYAWNVRVSNGSYYFDYHTPGKVYYDMQMTYPGIHNIENAVLALSIALSLGVNEYELRAALKSFKGMKRRFDLKCKTDETIYYDDYAHHPEEIEATITSLKHLYPNKRICGIFQPHLYSRTKDLADQFAEALENLDDIILLPIYPAREEAIPGITSKTILHKINKMDKYHVTKEQLFPLLSALQPELLVTLGAGDIDQLVEPIIQLLKEDE